MPDRAELTASSSKINCMESTHSDDQMFAALDEKIRAEAEAKMQAIRLVAVAHRTLTKTREEFAAQDAKNVSALDSALAEARKAGFRESDLAQWKSADKERKSTRRTPRGRRSTAKSSPTTSREDSPSPTDQPSASAAS
ncbi:hypothetical protein GS921_25265 [Rhodococcus hoagii]|nr:hypothetical protein [Prescottella equi]